MMKRSPVSLPLLRLGLLLLALLPVYLHSVHVARGDAGGLEPGADGLPPPVILHRAPAGGCELDLTLI